MYDPAAAQQQSSAQAFELSEIPGALHMKAFATIGLGSLGSISFQHAIQALPADRPHGVAADCWVRLDDKLGLVIDSMPPEGGSVTGRFMVKQAGTWHPLTLKVG
jgi:hypothetical protein